MVYEEIDSTNEQAKRLFYRAKDDSCYNVVCLAKKQLQGKGSKGREWVSLTGNLFFSMILLPQVSVHKWPQISFLAGLAVKEVIDTYLSFYSEHLAKETVVSYKWPNDILLLGRKISGILLEAVHYGKKSALILGVGVNLVDAPLYVSHSTCLQPYVNGIMDRAFFLKQFTDRFEKLLWDWYQEGFSPVRNILLRHVEQLGCFITVDTKFHRYQGVFTDIGSSGQLILQLPEGEEVSISVGDMV